MNKKLDDSLSEYFIKPEKGLSTEHFIIENIGLNKKVGNYLQAGYNPKKRFKLMKKEYNIAPENIVKPIELKEIDGEKMYVLERINGNMFIDSLYKVRNNKPFLYSIKQQLEETIEKLHKNGYVHGDLVNGNNIMLTKEGKIKLIDFLYIPKDFEYKEAFIAIDNEAVKSVINLMYRRFINL